VGKKNIGKHSKVALNDNIIYTLLKDYSKVLKALFRNVGPY